MANPQLDLIGSDEASRLIGIDRATLLRWRQDDIITEAIQMPGVTGAYMFHRADVEKVAEAWRNRLRRRIKEAS